MFSPSAFITTAVAEKLSALMTESYHTARAKHGSHAKYDRVPKKVRSRPAMTEDKI